jgi:replicative DNA helicase
MIDSLITQTIKQNDTTYLSKIPVFLLNDAEKKLIKYIQDYKEKHGQTPSPEKIKKEGYGHYLTDHYAGEPLSALFEDTLEQKRSEYFLKKSSEIQMNLDKDGKIDTSALAKLHADLSKTYVSNAVNFTSFDRKSFYSTTKPDSIKFGWDTIDNPTGGILPGEYAILVARLGVGKSLIAVYQAVQWARQGKRVLFIPCEMTIEQTIYRMDGFLGGFNPLVFRTKRAYGSSEDSDDDEIKTMFETYRKLVEFELDAIKKSGGEIIFPDKSTKTIQQIISMIRETKPDITIIDALYLVGNADGIVSSDWKVLKEVSNTIKQFCITDNQRVFCTSQIKRTGGKSEAEFSTEDIAYTDAFGQDADLVMVAYKVPAKPKQMVISLAKVRHGSDLGSVELEVDWRNMRLNVIDIGYVSSDDDDYTEEYEES